MARKCLLLILGQLCRRSFWEGSNFECQFHDSSIRDVRSPPRVHGQGHPWSGSPPTSSDPRPAVLWLHPPTRLAVTSATTRQARRRTHWMSDRESRLCVPAGTCGRSRPMRAQSPKSQSWIKPFGAPRRRGFSTAKGDYQFPGLHQRRPSLFFLTCK